MNKLTRTLCILTLFYLIPMQATFAGNKQDDEKQMIINLVKMLFNGMYTGDSTMVRYVFDENAKLYTVVSKDSSGTLVELSVNDFVAAVASPRDEIWNEKIWDLSIQIDGELASVWCNYTFFLGDGDSKQLIHCGVNSIEMYKSADGWKIILLTDTRRKTNCRSE